MVRAGVSEAAARLAELLDRAGSGEDFVIERSAKRPVRLVPVAADTGTHQKRPSVDMPELRGIPPGSFLGPLPDDSFGAGIL